MHKKFTGHKFSAKKKKKMCIYFVCNSMCKINTIYYLYIYIYIHIKIDKRVICDKKHISFTWIRHWHNFYYTILIITIDYVNNYKKSCIYINIYILSLYLLMLIMIHIVQYWPILLSVNLFKFKTLVNK